MFKYGTIINCMRIICFFFENITIFKFTLNRTSFVANINVWFFITGPHTCIPNEGDEQICLINESHCQRKEFFYSKNNNGISYALFPPVFVPHSLTLMSFPINIIITYNVHFRLLLVDTFPLFLPAFP